MKKNLVIKKNDIYNFAIIFLFISRLLVFFHFPSILNFFHFIFIIIGIIWSLFSPTNINHNLSIPILLIAIEILLSGTINFVGFFNIILCLIMVIEPFVIANNSIEWEEKNYIFIRKFLSIISLINLLISYFQYFVLGFFDDDVRGIFLGMGSGAHINGAFSIIMAIYCIYLTYNKYTKCDYTKKVIYSIYAILLLFIVVMCDNKQSILAFALGAILLIIFGSSNIKQTLKNLFFVTIGIAIVYLLTFSILSKITIWTSNIDEITMGLESKFSFINYLKHFDSSNIRKIIGFGPGMTLSRLARLLPEYSSYDFLGITISPMTSFFKKIYSDSWIMLSSSMWTYYFSWAAFYGDLGFMGVICIIFAYIKVYKYFCKNNVSRWIFYSMIVHGMIFDWLEEPAFVVSCILIMILINNDICCSKKID